MARTFTAQVDAWIAKSERRMDAVVRESAQEVFAEAQRPVGDGGRMRIDTGFLRASGQASVGFTGRPAEKNPYTEPNSAPGPQDTALVIATAPRGQTIYFTYAANYARIREYHDGFVRGAAMEWQRIVSSVVARARQMR